MASSPVVRLKTSKVTNEPRILRSGVVPYAMIGGLRYFAFFIDAKYHEITDGGGGVHRGLDFLEEGLRELKEESLGVLDYTSLAPSIRDVGTTLVGTIQGRRTAMTFFEIQIASLRVLQVMMVRYRRLYQKRRIEQACGEWVDPKTMENSFLLWMAEPDLKELSLEKKVSLDSFTAKLIFATSLPERPLLLKAPLFGSKQKVESYPRLYDVVRDILRSAFNSAPSLV